MSKERTRTVVVPQRVHEAMKILKRRYSSNGDIPTMGESVWRFIQDVDSELAAQTEEALTLQRKLEELRRGDNSS